MAAGLNGFPQSAKFYGKEKDIHGSADLCGIGKMKITPLAVEKNTVPAVALRALAVRQHQYGVPPKPLGEKLGIQDAQSAKTDDAHGFNFFHG